MQFALQKYRVICFGQAMAGPTLTRILADMGAEVIKVESHTKLDGQRVGKPVIGDDVTGGDAGKWPEMQPGFHNYNRNKRGILVNFKVPEGVELIKKLVKLSDIVADNFRPNLMDEVGLGHKDLVKVNPGIITISMTGLGEYGPMKDQAAYATTTTALAGLNQLVGYSDQPIGTIGPAYGDANASLHGIVAVLAALRYRNKTGKGQHIDLSETQAAVANLGVSLIEYVMNKRVMGPQENFNPACAPHNNYRCQGQDKWVAIAIRTEAEWKSFCEAIGNPPWTQEERFSSKAKRLQNRADLDKLVTAWTINYTPQEVQESLQKVGVAATVVMNIEDQFFDPHFTERETFTRVQHPLIGEETIYGIPWKLDRTPGAFYRHAPTLGQDNEYVFHELLGISREEISRLEKEKVIY